MDSRKTVSLSVPLFELLRSLGRSHFKDLNYFDTGTIFWSLTRLFGHYFRIMTVIKNSLESPSFLDSDIESFIIRMRVILNDTAFIIRQLLPDYVRDLKSPKGPVDRINKEMRIKELFKLIFYSWILETLILQAHRHHGKIFGTTTLLS